MYYLAVCACFKDTAEYLREWLLFHLAQGVEHFFLYDNDSTDGADQVLAPFVAAGKVTVLRWPGTCQQPIIYADALARYAGRARWIGFIDDDEFAYPSYGKNLRDRTLADVLTHYESFAGVSVSWMLYGSSGQVKKEPGRVIERFLHRHPNPDSHQKCFIQPERISHSTHLGHAFAAKDGFTVVDEKCVPIDTPLHKNPSADIVRLNHYLMKSREEFLVRRSKPLADSGKITPRPFEEWFKDDRLHWSEFLDASALETLPAILALEGKYT